MNAAELIKHFLDENGWIDYELETDNKWGVKYRSYKIKKERVIMIHNSTNKCGVIIELSHRDSINDVAMNMFKLEEPGSLERILKWVENVELPSNMPSHLISRQIERHDDKNELDT